LAMYRRAAGQSEKILCGPKRTIILLGSLWNRVNYDTPLPLAAIS
jgi:hypothetical protein